MLINLIKSKGQILFQYSFHTRGSTVIVLLYYYIDFKYRTVFNQRDQPAYFFWRKFYGKMIFIKTFCPQSSSKIVKSSSRSICIAVLSPLSGLSWPVSPPASFVFWLQFSLFVSAVLLLHHLHDPLLKSTLHLLHITLQDLNVKINVYVLSIIS